MISIEYVYDVLDNTLPMIPAKPKIQQYNPPPYKTDPKTGANIKIKFGRLYPEQQEEED